jgi:hypothetical protein
MNRSRYERKTTNPLPLILAGLVAACGGNAGPCPDTSDLNVQIDAKCDACLKKVVPDLIKDGGACRDVAATYNTCKQDGTKDCNQASNAMAGCFVTSELFQSKCVKGED